MNNLIGQHLGPYRILEQIGIGGMATVYKAYQPAMDRYVAVKVIAAHFAQDETFLRRFRREARAVAQLEHAHILPVHDFGEAEGRPYLVMRFLEAGTLKDRIAQGSLPLSEVNRVVGQVGSALDYAHRMGVIHRDVKPTNVLLDAEGDAFLTDFGLARMMEASVQLTETGVGIGTPAYMSPEQGKGAKADSRSDVYSLGVMLYEMVTGRVPYEAETPLAVVLKHIQDPLPLPRSVQPDLPEEVERVILRALAKDPDDRFQTAGEMVRALDAAVRAAEAAVPTEPAVPAARPEPAAAEVAARPPEGAVTGARKVLQAKWARTAAWAAAGVVVLAAFLFALSRVPLKVQISGGQLEVVRVEEGTPALSGAERATPEAAPTATATPMPTLLPTPSPTLSHAPIPRPTTTPTAVTVKWSYTPPGAIWAFDSWGDGLATGDLNDDGIPDVAFGTEGGYVIAVDGGDGEELWSYRITTQTGAPVNADVVDVDGDGVPDVVGTGKGDSTSQGKAIIGALDRDGTKKWQVLGDYEEVVDLAYGDVDGDGDTDVVASVGTYPWDGGQVILLDGATGTRVWAQSLGSGHAQGIDARDVDGDGDMEIAVENYDNKVFLLDGSAGSILWSRPKDYHGRDVIIEDVDDDGAYEIVSAVANVTSYSPDGNQEWATAQGGDLVSSGDVNGDGQTEVVFSSAFAGDLHAVKGSTGEELWSRTRSGVHTVGDVNGDGVDDIVMGTIRFYGIEPPYSVDAVDGSNNLLWSYPLDSIFNEGGFGLAVANLDSDPALEVLVANGTQLLALDTASVTSTASFTSDQARAFAEPILAAVADRPPDFEDDFSDPSSGWRTGTGTLDSGAGWQTGYRDGEYFVWADVGPEGGAGYGGSNPSITLPADFVLEIDGRFVSGENGEWNVMFRRWEDSATDRGGFAILRIHTEPHVSLGRMEAGADEDLFLIVHRGDPVRGSSETNHVRLIARGPEIAVYVNGEPVIYGEDDSCAPSEPYLTGRLDLGMWHSGDKPMEARWDNLRIWDISDLELPSTEATPVPTGDATLYGCQPGERLLYLNDFEDGEPSFGPWVAEETPGGGLALHAVGDGMFNVVDENDPVTETRIAFRVQPVSDEEWVIHFRWREPPGDKYNLTGWADHLELALHTGGSVFPLASAGPLTPNRWASVEIVWESRHTLVVRIDGAEVIRHTLPEDPLLERGGIHLDHPSARSEAWFDDIVVCGR